MPRSTVRVLLGASLVAAAACGNNTVTTPTPTTPTTLTETFSGTLTVNGAASHSFVVQTSGTVTAGINSLSPDSTAVVGLSLGTWNGATCQIVIANTRAQQGSVVIGTATSLGNLCVFIQDTGQLAAPTTYEIQVAHP